MQDCLHDRNIAVKYCPDCGKEIDVKEFYKNRNGVEKYCKVHKMLRQKFENALKFKSAAKPVPFNQQNPK
jgi:hypothetical protein